MTATLESERRLVKDRCNSLEERLISAEERALSLQHELERAKCDHRGEELILQRGQRDVERRQQELEEKRSKLEGDYSELEHTLELTVVARDRAEHDKVLTVLVIFLFFLVCVGGERTYPHNRERENYIHIYI